MFNIAKNISVRGLKFIKFVFNIFKKQDMRILIFKMFPRSMSRLSETDKNTGPDFKAGSFFFVGLTMLSSETVYLRSLIIIYLAVRRNNFSSMYLIVHFLGHLFSKEEQLRDKD